MGLVGPSLEIQNPWTGPTLPWSIHSKWGHLPQKTVQKFSSWSTEIYSLITFSAMSSITTIIMEKIITCICECLNSKAERTAAKCKPVSLVWMWNHSLTRQFYHSYFRDTWPQKQFCTKTEGLVADLLFHSLDLEPQFVFLQGEQRDTTCLPARGSASPWWGQWRTHVGVCTVPGITCWHQWPWGEVMEQPCGFGDPVRLG